MNGDHRALRRALLLGLAIALAIALASAQSIAQHNLDSEYPFCFALLSSVFPLRSVPSPPPERQLGAYNRGDLIHFRD